MKEFKFRAPTLFDANAAVTAEFEIHDAPGTAEDLVKIRRIVSWLRSEMVSAGLPARTPDFDEGGWTIVVPSNGASVQFVVYSSRTDITEIVVDVVELGNASKDIADDVAEVLRRAPQIRNFRSRDV